MKVPHSNTQRGVNQTVFEALQSRQALQSKTMLDVPCGQGVFANFIQTNFPHMKVIGADPFEKVENPKFEFHKLEAQKIVEKIGPEAVDIITCISGVMCFDGLRDLFQHFQKSLRRDGILVVTNDNIMTVRDRLNFLFFGSFKRFKLIYSPSEGNWNVVPPQSLYALFQLNGFKKIEVRYSAFYLEDALMLPLAFPLYVIFLIKLLLTKSSLTLSEKMNLFPFKSMLYRHYVISAQK